MAKVLVLIDSWTSWRASHIVRKRTAMRVRWRAMHVRARDREGARERDRWGLDRVLLCIMPLCSLPVYPVDRPHASETVYRVDSLLNSLPSMLPSTAVYP